jgi:cyanocobalamin reductase (cyanide-eliminating) / alkylcobalamin dealkylase
VVNALAAALAARGLDLTAAFAAADYDAEVAPALRLPSFGRDRALAVVVGNTAALWPRFTAARPAGADPLDAYVTAAVTAALALAEAPRHEVRWAHTAPATVAIQRAAHVAGLAYLAPSHLSVHPVFGPWIALRAVIVLDADGPAPAPAPIAPCDCARHCAPALADALAAGVPTGRAELAARWRRWLAVRDACPVGRAHRYGDDQIRFHYGADLPCAKVQGPG